MQRTDPYEILGVAPDADEQTLRLAYRRLVRAHHPDLMHSPQEREAANARMQRIHEAWKTVGTPQNRALFDAFLEPQNAQENAEFTPFPKPPRLRKNETPRVSSARRKLQKLRRQHSAHEFKTHNRAALFEARSLFEKGFLDEAQELCRRVLRRDFRSVRARVLLGEIYLARDEKTKALALFEQALALQNANPHLRARVLQLRGELPAKAGVRFAPETEAPLKTSGKTPESLWQSLRAILRRSPRAKL